MRSNWFSFFLVFLVFYFSFSTETIKFADRILGCEQEKDLCDSKSGTLIRQRWPRTCDECSNDGPCINDSRCANWFQGNCTSAVSYEKRRWCLEVINKATKSRPKRAHGHQRSKPRPQKHSVSKAHHEEPEIADNEDPYEFFKESLNETVDPCDDFYEFTCGSYIASHRSRWPHESFDLYEDLQTRVEEQQKQTVLYDNHPSNSAAVNKVLLFRDKCLDVKSIETNSSSLWQSMQAIGQGVPMFSADFDPDRFDLEDTLIKIAEASGTRVMYKLKTHQSEDGRTHLMVEADELIVASPEFYAKPVEPKLALLLTFLYKIIRLIWEDQNPRRRSPNLRKQVNEVILHDYRLSVKFRPNKLGNPVETGGAANDMRRLDDLKAAVTMINWDRYLTHDSLLSDEVKTHLMENPLIYLHSEHILKEVDAVHRAANKKVLANYLFVRFVMNSLPFLDRRFLEAKMEFSREWHDPTYTSKREDMCYGIIMNVFPTIADHLYMRTHLKHETVETMERMIHDLRSGMTSIFHEAKWMTKKTKTTALKKLRKMRTIIGAMDDIKDEKKLDERYEEVHLATSDSLLQISQKIQKFYEKRRLEKLANLPLESLAEPKRINEVNAGYILARNEIFLRLAILQAPFLNLAQPAAVSYGAIGFIVGHEMTHAFDVYGSQFDEDGGNKYWFDAETERKFDSRAVCLVHLYNKQVEPTVFEHVNGSKTVTENIADFGGIRAAFKAYKRRLGGKHEQHVSGYGKYTNEQTFFIAYGTSECDSLSREKTKRNLEVDTHAPSRFRVNVVLANFPKFAQVFKCKSGTKMNPKKRCLFW